MYKVIAVFGSGVEKRESNIYNDAYKVGKAIGGAGYKVITGGYLGIMEAASKGCHETGMEVIGVTSEIFGKTGNVYLSKEISTKNLPERLSRLVDEADAYVIFPGRTGTLLEVAYLAEFINKGMIKNKIVVFLGSYWNRITDFIIEENQLLGKYLYFVNNETEVVKILSKHFRSNHEDSGE